MTYIFCLGSNRHFCEELKKRFSDPENYTFFSSSNAADLLRESKTVSRRSNCKVAIIETNEPGEQQSEIEDFTRDLKRAGQYTGLILIHSPERSGEIKKSIVFNIDAYIQRNGSTIPRLHNAVRKMISEHMLRQAGRRFKIALYTLSAFLILSGIMALLKYLFSPAG